MKCGLLITPHGKIGSMFERLKQIYSGKKIFLTGHTGFKGSWLLKTLSMLGADIKGYALEPNTADDLYCLINGDNLCQSVIGDLRDKERILNEVLQFQPDFIFHLAAQPLVRLSYKIPSETFAVNAIGTAHVLDALHKLEKVCNAVLITTDKVYQNNEWVYPYRETDRLGGYDPYSASKACTELVIDSYRNSFFNVKNYSNHLKGIAVGRAGNVIGGGDWSSDRLVPDIIRSLKNEENIVLRNPGSIRPWQHVLEPIFGYLLLGANLNKEPVNFSQAYNFGPHLSDALPVVEMVNLAINSWGKGNYVVKNEVGQPHEAGLLKLDISKAINELGWEPKMSAVTAIEETISWYKAYKQDERNILEFTTQQIMSYFLR